MTGFTRTQLHRSISGRADSQMPQIPPEVPEQRLIVECKAQHSAMLDTSLLAELLRARQI
jgi:hypothetical protein